MALVLLKTERTYIYIYICILCIYIYIYIYIYMRLKRGRTGREDAGGDDSFYRPHQPRQVYFIVIIFCDSFINLYIFFSVLLSL
jgi:hypothetical protein